MDTPVSKSGPQSARPSDSELLLPSFPSRMFFDAKDYGPGFDRRKVSEARSRSVAELQRKKDQFGIAIAGLRTADDYGLVRNAFEVLEEVAAAILKEAKALARLSHNAEARYDEAHPIVEPAVALCEELPASPAVEVQRAAGITVTYTGNIRPSAVSEAMAVRNAKLLELNRGRA